MEKYGFIYIWYDRKWKRYYVGCHWGREDDGYICSSKWMSDSYKRRPVDFKRKILKRIYTNMRDLRDEEHKWLLLIKDEEIKIKYYNLSKKHFGHWSADEHSKLSISQKLSKAQKERFENNPELRKKSSECIKKYNIVKYRKEWKVSEEHKLKTSKTMLSLKLKRTEETKKKIKNKQAKRYLITYEDEHSEIFIGLRDNFISRRTLQEALYHNRGIKKYNVRSISII
jgi:hypothetical protein